MQNIFQAPCAFKYFELLVQSIEYSLVKELHVLFPFGQIKSKALLENFSSGLKHVSDVLEIGDNSSPALLLKMLIVNETFASSGLFPSEGAALLGKLSPSNQSPVGRRHAQRSVDLFDEIDI